jgi:protein-disulfide isomerase
VLIVDPQVDHLKGDPEAPNVIIEYANFLCHYCGMFFEENLPDVLELVDQGRAVYIYRHFAFTPGAETVAIAAECAAAQGEAFFFPYHDLIFENQRQVAAGDDVAVGALGQFAIDLGLDSEEFDDCLANRTTQARVDRDYRSALTLEVTGTPTFFINGQKLEGVHAVEDFEALMLVE